MVANKATGLLNGEGFLAEDDLCCRLRDGYLRGLSSEIDEFEQILVVGYSGGALTVLLLFKYGISVKLELKCRRNKGTRRFVVHCFQSAEVLLYGVV